MIPTMSLNGPWQIGGKLLTYSKPIVGNGKDCELVGLTLEYFGLNEEYSSPCRLGIGTINIAPLWKD